MARWTTAGNLHAIRSCSWQFSVKYFCWSKKAHSSANNRGKVVEITEVLTWNIFPTQTAAKLVSEGGGSRTRKLESENCSWIVKLFFTFCVAAHVRACGLWYFNKSQQLLQLLATLPRFALTDDHSEANWWFSKRVIRMWLVSEFVNL